MEEFKKVVLKKYAEFNGRARRREFWMFVLFSFIISVVLSILDNILGTKVGNGTGIFGSLFSLAILVPSIAVTVRRLHDTNHSGWWWFLLLIPIIVSIIFLIIIIAFSSLAMWWWFLWLIIFIGWVIMIVWLATDSTPGDNQYGPNPKRMPAAPAPSVA